MHARIRSKAKDMAFRLGIAASMKGQCTSPASMWRMGCEEGLQESVRRRPKKGTSVRPRKTSRESDDNCETMDMGVRDNDKDEDEMGP